MSHPRAYRPGASYLLTRRLERRLFRMMPRPEVMAAFAVALAEASRRSGVVVAAICVLSNHYHAVVHDPEGRLPDFLRDLHATVARFCNAVDEVRLKFWDGRQTFVEELLDADVVLSKMAYVIANPVKHRLVASPEAWSGVRTRLADVGSGRGARYVRPEGFFDDAAPAEVELVSVLPPMCVAAYGVEGFRARLGVAVKRLVARVRREAVKDGRGFVGMEAVMRQSPFAAPDTSDQRETGHDAPAARRHAGAEVAAAVERERVFRKLHEDARLLFIAGQRDVVFPAGTWHAWRYYGAKRAEDRPALRSA